MQVLLCYIETIGNEPCYSRYSFGKIRRAFPGIGTKNHKIINAEIGLRVDLDISDL